MISAARNPKTVPLRLPPPFATRLDPHRTAVVLIGFQNDFFAAEAALLSALDLPPFDALANTVAFLDALQASPVLTVYAPINFSTDYSELLEPVGVLAAVKALGAFQAGAPGSSRVAALERFADRLVERSGGRGVDVFAGSGLDQLLMERGVDDVVLAGALTSVFIDAAARSAHDRGFRVWVLGDCTASASRAEQKVLCEDVFPLYARVTDHRTLISLLAGDGDAGSHYGVSALKGEGLAVQIQHRILEALRQQKPPPGDPPLHDSHDPLTGLASRSLLQEHLRRVLERALRKHWSTAVIALDIDYFGKLNDVLGRRACDALLVEVGRRLPLALRGYDTVSRPSSVARFYGDEFFVVCEHVPGKAAAMAIGARLAEVISAPINLDDHVVTLSVSTGVALSRRSKDPEELILEAELAMQEAKDKPADRRTHFVDATRSPRRRTEAEAALAQALAEGQFHLAYQPKVLLATGQISGVEALLRWEHPRRGVVPPGDFIALAERSGLIVPIGAWVLEEACRQAFHWATSFPDRPPLKVSVNVSGRQFDSDVTASVARALGASEVGPDLLCLELTESTVMSDVEAAVCTLKNLKTLGVTMSIDDFGTGYSSLAYLRRLPLDEIKVDKSFVEGLGHDPEETAIVAAIIGMAHALHMEVVAEGVETKEQSNALKALGCEYAQGFYFSHPRPPEAVDALLMAEARGPWPGRCSRRGHRLRDADGPGNRQQVLVVADSPEAVQFGRLSLTTAGFEVHEAQTGRQALALAENLRPDCILVDLTAQELDGFNMCRMLRAHPAASESTIVVVSSARAAQRKAVVFLAGADDCVVKPYAPRDLAVRVRAAITRRQQVGD